MEAFWNSFYQELGRRSGFYLTVALGSGAIGAVFFWDPFYHLGWILAYKDWIGLLVVACAIAIAVSHSLIGLIIVIVLAGIAATAFGHLYANPDYLDGNWPFRTWLLHMVFLSLMIGIFVGGGIRLTHSRAPVADKVPSEIVADQYYEYL